MTDLSFGATVPQWSADAGPAAWRRVATAAEDAGFDAVWKGDHVTFPESLGSGGVAGSGPQTPTYDAFTALAYLAGVTDEVTLGTNVCVAPYRHPVLLAKLVLSLDAIAGGRFAFGVGAGWLESEFDVLDVPHDERGPRTTEFLRLFRAVCADDVVDFDGEFHAFPETGFVPRPTTPGGPTVLVGGDSSAAVRRVAAFGDGWTLVGVTPDEAHAQRERLLAAWADHDRDGTPAFAVTQTVRLDDGEDRDGDDGPLCGTVEEVVAGVEAYAEAGVTHLNLRNTSLSVDERVAQVRRLGDDVLPSFE